MSMSNFDAKIFLLISAPEPSDDELMRLRKLDKQRNPHGDYHKPKLRDTMELIVDYKLEYVRIALEKLI